MEICVVSKQYIKPSSPTPPHLSTLNLSLLDQVAVGDFASIALFYRDHPPVDSLKRSLAETLTLFYPLAGVIKDDLTIECKDQGAYFVETNVKGQMKDFLARPDQDLISQLFPPVSDIIKPSEPARVTNIQANTFECGGIAITCCMNHKYVDGVGLATFLKAWAATTTSEGDDGVIRVTPNFIAPNLFPSSKNTDANEVISGGLTSFLIPPRLVQTKRFLFNPSSIKELQGEAAREAGTDRPLTRVEAVSACIWRSFINASLINKGADNPKPTILSLSMDLRRRASTLPLNHHSFGNMVFYTGIKQPESELTLSLLARKIREAIGKLDQDFVARLSCNGSETLKSVLGDLSSEAAGCVDLISIISWCRFGLYDVNFGKEGPVWAAPWFLIEAESKIFHAFRLNDAADGEGIEAWFCSTKPYIDSFVRDMEHHQVAALVDPNPMKLAD